MDLKRIHSSIKAEILSSISSIIDRSAFILGSEVEQFEKEFASFIETKASLGVANGLDALKLALQASNIGPGDEVITAANTFAATAFAISSVGARPVFVDIENDTFNIDPARVAEAITSRTKAILPVHLYGQPATMTPLLELSKSHHLSMIEDCAQAHGAAYLGRNVGTLGDAGCFSFYPGKNLGAMGDGGAITTSNPDLLKTLKILRDVGQSEKYHHTHIGHNSRLDAMQAAILSIKLKHLQLQTEERVKLAKRYGELLSSVASIQLPKTLSDRTHVFHLYVITTQNPADRDPLRKHLGEQGIQTGLHYPIPLHLQKCYSDLGYKAGDFPTTEKISNSLLSIPIFPGMTEEELQTVAREIKRYFGC